MSWATVRRDRLGDGTPVAVKDTTYDARLEADGLQALARAGAPVPEVIDVDEHRLVMEWVEGPADWERVGRGLAAAHLSTADAFGYHRNNVIGPLVQDNTWHDDWADFYVERRIVPFLADLPADLARRLRRAGDGPLRELLGSHRPRPGLVHGDLWSGNVVAGRSLVDPAVCYADPELDRAFSELFGGLPARLWAAHDEVAPPAEGWRDRLPALQLYHLLVHVRLFGGHYVTMVADRLAVYGW